MDSNEFVTQEKARDLVTHHTAEQQTASAYRVGKGSLLKRLRKPNPAYVGRTRQWRVRRVIRPWQAEMSGSGARCSCNALRAWSAGAARRKMERHHQRRVDLGLCPVEHDTRNCHCGQD